MKQTTLSLLFFCFACALIAQDAVIPITKKAGDLTTIAVPDLRGSGGAERFMDAFNATLWRELENSAVFKMAPKTTYPLSIPQQPSDFRQPPATGNPSLGGRALSDWSLPPVSANHIAIGFTSVAADQIVLSGWLVSLTQPLGTPPLIAKRYFGPVTAAGAKKVAIEFAADIMAQFGGKSLGGSKIYFVSDRTGAKEVWQMNYDGTEAKQLTQYGALLRNPAVSADGTRLAFTTWRDGTPDIYIQSLVTGRRLTFYNQHASLNMTPEFLPDGSKMLFSSSITGHAQIYMVNPDGSGLKSVATTRSIDVEARVNPKTGREIAFVSDRTGHPQIFKMSLDGTDVQQLTPGDGEAVNPSWHPDGKLIAFSWTHGFDIGNFNIFIMDIATRAISQLTHGAGRNENPSWAPDGYHLVFMAKRGPKFQIYTMLADGTQVHQLTTEGNNEQPVWSRGTN